MTPLIEIAIAEDHKLVRQGYVRMLSDYDRIKILFEASNGQELLRKLHEHKPMMVLLDISMPVIGGIKAMQEIRTLYPKVKILVISAYSELESIIEYVKLGACAFLPKECSVQELVTAIFRVYENGTYFDDTIQKVLSKKGANPPGAVTTKPLSEKEKLILKHLCSNTSPDKIAKALDIKVITVDWYKHKLMMKTGSESMADLMQYAKKNNII